MECDRTSYVIYVKKKRNRKIVLGEINQGKQEIQ